VTQPAFSGAPQPVQGVTGGPGLPQGVASVEGSTGNVVVSPPANTLQIRKGASPQSIQVYEFYNSATDNVRIELLTQTNGPEFIGVRTAPGNVARDLRIGTTNDIFIATGGNATGQWRFTAAGNLIPVTTNVSSIGDSTHSINQLWAFQVIVPNLTLGSGNPMLTAGVGAPNPGAGTNGDIYFNAGGAALTTIYQRRAGTWVGIV